MKKSLHKQLKLEAQTVRRLSTAQLDAVFGGWNRYTGACAQQTNRCMPGDPP